MLLIFDRLYAKTRIDITSDIGSKMTLNIEINQKNNITTHVDFSYKGIKVDYGRLDARIIFLMIDAYHKYIDTKISTSHVSILSWERLRHIKSFGKLFRNVRKYRKVLERYQNLSSVNIFTLDRFQNKILARTIIELDADIITIIPRELLSTDSVNIYTTLHRANIRLANYLYLYPLIRIFAIIKAVKNLSRLISILLWISFSLIMLPPTMILKDYNYLFMIFNFVGIPAMLYKFIPKIVAFIIRRKLM